MDGTVQAADRPFAELLRALRERAGLTQEELAGRAGITPHAVSALERGIRTRPYPHTVRSLADGLGLDNADRAWLLAAVRQREARTPVTLPALAPGGRTLPVPATPLVGRACDVTAAAAMLGEHRILTVTGPGGVGKTRLSLAVAAAASGFVDEVVFVALAPLSDPRQVMPSIAAALGLNGLPATEVGAAVAGHVGDRRLLLVLDNAEHVRQAGPDVALLVGACPELRVLVSSRAALRVRGEAEYPVSPLALPADGCADSAALLASPAGELLVQRARAVRPDFVVTAANAAAVAGICADLGGLPLALELAAAHLRHLDPATLRTRLDAVMAADGPRDLPDRQRTMRATLEWSHRLLGDAEQRLFETLSVFAGGASLDAICQVAADCPDVLPTLGALVEQSLVLTAPGPFGEFRYGMLEPVRQFAWGKLAARGATETVQAHARYFATLAERAWTEYQHAEQLHWLERVDADAANMTAAIERSLASGDPDDAAIAGRLCWGNWLYWWLRGRVALGRRLAEAVLGSELPDPVRARTALAAAAMAFADSDSTVGVTGWHLSLEIGRSTGDVAAQAHGWAGQGLVALAAAQLSEAERNFAAAAELVPAMAESGPWLGALVDIWRGTVRLASGDPAGAVGHVRAGLENARRRRDRLAIYIALFNLSEAALALGDYVAAQAHLREGIKLSRETRDVANLGYFLDALAAAEKDTTSPERIATLLGAAQGMREAVGAVVYGYYTPDATLRDRAAAQAQSLLGVDAFEDALDAGRAMDLSAAVTFALGARD